MCIFCKSNTVEEFEDNNYGNKIIECKNCNSKVKIKNNEIYILKHPNWYKHIWVIILTIPIWFFINGLIGLLIVKNIFNKNMPLSLLFIPFIPFFISLFIFGVQNIYNFIKNGYMILKWSVTTYNSGKFDIAITFLISLMLSIMGFLVAIQLIFECIGIHGIWWEKLKFILN
jgi:DNA-directed RNA polymerase subunit RPC12/RpoP